MITFGTFHPRTWLAIAHDFVAAAFAWWFAYQLRFNFDLPPAFGAELWQTLPFVVALQGTVFFAFGLYRGVWRYASVGDVRRIVLAVAAATAGLAFLLWMLKLPLIVPRSVLVLDPLLLVLVMGGSRLLYRMWKENLLYGDITLRGEPVLVLGAGDAAVALSKELARSARWHVAGFLDDDPGKQGLTQNGIRVLGALDELPRLAEKMSIVQAIVAMPSVSHRERRRAITLCESARVKALTVPAYDDLLSGKVSVSQLREVELDDLLGRDPVVLDTASLQSLLHGKTVLITGAGGSIGAELCQQVARFVPSRLVLYEIGEFALYQIEQSLAQSFPNLDIVYLAGDVKDEARLEEVFVQYHPQVVFHAAAYKHVPLMERGNTWQAVRNNVFGTWQVAHCAQRHGAEKFVLISTDKAVNPTNVMGTTKRMAEMVCQGMQQAGGTRFVIVRFGNVLGSNGSVIPKFREQIARGGPVTVTHPEITRYFMSIPEAAQLVMQAGAMGNGGEIFVLDMGEPVKIVDLAHTMIRLSGFSEEDIRIEFAGLRPGEKLYEELLADDENTLPTPHPKLRVAMARPPEQWQSMLDWAGGTGTETDTEVRRCLRQWVPEYMPAAH
ncbi:MAG: nucleoside-diphosphate sugar epimerase/dehydratase [Sideroxydans sp.]|jgi:FlaA1/EpsC-like NDP-sugar epimerase